MEEDEVDLVPGGAEGCRAHLVGSFRCSERSLSSDEDEEGTARRRKDVDDLAQLVKVFAVDVDL